MTNIGVYLIENKANKKVYVGQSVDIRKRKRAHLSNLRRNCHPNTYLQNSFNKYGEKNFVFTILKKCKTEDLDELEMKYISEYNSIGLQNGYNLRYGGNDTTFSESTKEKMSKSSRKRFENKDYAIKYFSDINRTISLDVVSKIKKMLYEDIEVDEIVRIMGVGVNKVNHIFSIQSFKHICPEYNLYLSIRSGAKRKKLIRGILRMYADNCTYQSIADIHDVHIRTAMRIVGSNKKFFHDVQRENVEMYYKTKLQRKVLTMYAFGESKLNISRLLGISRNTIIKIIKQDDEGNIVKED